MPKRKDLARPREGRPQAPPPALMRGDEGIQGNSILEEVKGSAGIVLWQSLRDAVLWAHTPPPRRELFAPGRERARLARIVAHDADPEILGALTTIARVLGSNPPNERREVATACRAISQWADNRGLLRTALAFAQGAAIVVPDDAAAAYRVGWLARRRAEYERAETWFRRAIGLSRRSGDRHAFAMAHIGLANLHMQRGSLSAAREALLRAHRTARRSSLRQAKAMALHDLFVIAAYTNRVEEARVYARGAFNAYGRNHARLPILANDIAWFWTLRGHHDRALPVARAALGHARTRAERVLVMATVARAAGGLRDLVQFTEAWNEVWRLVDEMGDAENVPEALLHLEYGAAYLGDGTRVEIAAEHAMRLASGRGEERVVAEARQCLEVVRSSNRNPVYPPAPAEHGEAEVDDALIAELVLALAERAARR